MPAVTRLPTAWLMPLVSWSVKVPLVSTSPARLIVLLRALPPPSSVIGPVSPLPPMVLVESCTSPWPVSVIGWLPLLLTVLVTVNDVPLLTSIEPAAEMAPRLEIRLPLSARLMSPLLVATSVPAVTRLPTAWLIPLASGG